MALAKYLQKAKANTDNRPKIIVAETIKGFGLKCIENIPKFHFRIPTEQEIARGKSYGN
jgi:transketolase